ncbi:hypothetical protein [Paraburkholderia ginsengiterrae]|uniref:hypothetical protein n=1 Tax=Paraburkholderia ginsengiterrae TaxID=1462993 RepID=UPI001ABF57B7|nr:hypothetical protein [Paraburkholderia ginsengiterrae]
MSALIWSDIKNIVVFHTFWDCGTSSGLERPKSSTFNGQDNGGTGSSSQHDARTRHQRPVNPA